jgi:hypothetical protein
MNVLNFGNKGYKKAQAHFEIDEVSLAPHFSEVLLDIRWSGNGLGGGRNHLTEVRC